MVELADTKTGANDELRTRWVGVYIAILAVMFSFVSMIASNVDKDAAKANLDATNTWAFFQAKNIRRQQYSLAADGLRLKLAENPTLDAQMKSQITAKLDQYDKKVAEYTSDKKSNEGLDELFVQGKALEEIRDLALKRGPYFDYSETLLQIAIVLASVAIVTGGASALVLSALTGVTGILLAINGLYLFVHLPGL
jgi:hypothetical protein